MPLTRSSTRKLLGEPGKILKLHNKELGPKGTMPQCTSSRPELKNRTTGCPVKKFPPYFSSPIESFPIPEQMRGPTMKQIGESALSDYNKQHGTDLEYVRPWDDKDNMEFMGPGYAIDFTERQAVWKHFNFVARRRHADPSDKPLLLFAEVHENSGKSVLTSLLEVEPTNGVNGCQRCLSNINHPRHGFRSGFYTKGGKESKTLSEQVAAELSKFALQDYNEKHGTSLKFVRALSGNSFKSVGVLMDFSKKETSWVHMNFEARVGRYEEVLGLFAELYLGNDDKYVLSTLSVAEPSNVYIRGDWKKKTKIEHGLCRCCPEEIYHTWRGFRYAYDYPPRQNDP